MADLMFMPDIDGDHLCSICQLGKGYGAPVCKNIMSHAGKWNIIKKVKKKK